MITSIVYLIGGIIEAILGLRIVLRLIGANPANDLVALVYNLSTPIVAPFSGILGQDATVVSGVGAVTESVFDWVALIALIVVAVIMALLANVLGHRRAV